MARRPTRIIKDSGGNDVEVPTLPEFMVNGRNVGEALTLIDTACMSLTEMGFDQSEFLTIVSIYLASHAYTLDRISIEEEFQSANPILGFVSRVMHDVYFASDTGENRVAIHLEPTSTEDVVKQDALGMN